VTRHRVKPSDSVEWAARRKHAGGHRDQTLALTWERLAPRCLAGASWLSFFLPIDRATPPIRATWSASRKVLEFVAVSKPTGCRGVDLLGFEAGALAEHAEAVAFKTSERKWLLVQRKSRTARGSRSSRRPCRASRVMSTARSPLDRSAEATCTLSSTVSASVGEGAAARRRRSL
jgi:hypothetical protein